LVCVENQVTSDDAIHNLPQMGHTTFRVAIRYEICEGSDYDFSGTLANSRPIVICRRNQQIDTICLILPYLRPGQLWPLAKRSS
jgi:hypothetical protein